MWFFSMTCGDYFNSFWIKYSLKKILIFIPQMTNQGVVTEDVAKVSGMNIFPRIGQTDLSSIDVLLKRGAQIVSKRAHLAAWDLLQHDIVPHSRNVHESIITAYVKLIASIVKAVPIVQTCTFSTWDCTMFIALSVQMCWLIVPCSAHVSMDT